MLITGLRHFAQRSNFNAFIVFVMVWLSGISSFSLLGLLAVHLFTELPVLSDPSLIDRIMQPSNLKAARILQTVSAIGMFILPGWLFAKIMRFETAIMHVRPLLLAVAFFIPLVALPLVDWLSAFNNSLTFPIPSIDQWMKASEANAITVYETLLQMNGVPDLAFNLFMMALIPAVGEELFFRASLQPFFQKIFGNRHAAVWTTAILFSAIHIQFYTFIPRVVMGAGLGYLFLFGRNINYAIIAHFTNNAMAVLLAYYVVDDATIEKLESSFSSFSPWVIGSILATVLLYGMFFWSTKKARNV